MNESVLDASVWFVAGIVVGVCGWLVMRRVIDGVRRWLMPAKLLRRQGVRRRQSVVVEK